MGFFDKLKQGLFKTKNAIVGKIDTLFKAFSKVDEDLFDELEELLIMSDVGVNATEEIIERLREQIKDGRLKTNSSGKVLVQSIIDYEGIRNQRERAKLNKRGNKVYV